MEHTVGLCHRVEQLVQAQYVGAHEAAPRIRQRRLHGFDRSERQIVQQLDFARPAGQQLLADV